MAPTMGPAQRAVFHCHTRLLGCRISAPDKVLCKLDRVTRHSSTKQVWIVNMHILAMHTAISRERRLHEAQVSHFHYSPLYMPTPASYDIKQVGKYQTSTTVENLVPSHVTSMALKLSLLNGSSGNLVLYSSGLTLQDMFKVRGLYKTLI